MLDNNPPSYLGLITCLSTSLFVSGTSILHADETMLDEIIVTTGTKTERKLLDVPVRTEVVTKQELENTHARDLAEGLKNVPGILLKPIHGKSGQEVWLQGLDADRVLVLIDGKPVSASTGSSVDLSQISVGDIDHIEIVKGAVSALYGSEAMGGVVNIITSKSDKPFSYSVVADTGTYGNKNVGGDFNNKHIKVDLTRNIKKWHARLATDFRDNGGTDLDKSTFSFEGDSGLKANASAELDYSFNSDTTLGIKTSFYKEDLTRDFVTFFPGIGNVKKVKGEIASRKNVTLSFDKSFKSGAKLSSWIMSEKFNDDTSQDTLRTALLDQERKGRHSFNKGDIQWDQPIGESQLFSVGLTSLKNSLQQTQTKIQGNQTNFVDETLGKKNRKNTEIYIQDDIFVSDKLELLPGFRYQDDSDFGSHTAPKINLMYTPDWSSNFDTKLRVGIGKGYRVPTLKDRYYVFDHSALGYMVLGNPKIQPESSDNFSVGLELAKKGKFQAELSLFHNNIKDLIDTDLDVQESIRTGLSIFRYTNIGKARTQGFDLSTHYTFSPKISGTFAYSYLDAVDKETNNKLTERPENQIKVKLDYKLPQLKANISLYGNYQSKEYIDLANTRTSPGYSTFDLKINKQIRKGTKVFLGIDNITDTHRDVPVTGEDFRPESGRFIYAGIRFDG